ncbi:hypothetical protein EF847_07030 [Actinobacteria bacterium YIM 96077]|uniref:Teneurin NHL domain-containing protein n=1 Tax=Phytoactinopolyspora halophila TaxID=1981511 RepID=A0A329QBS6_9ACTN|nr:hypothetical protein EF847_07030 [Actinobacteria bacterium YIM 96077]RAW09441.1 hypothetical protein DPM12_21240 [Phytoactinopolyspora halophila]
MLGCLTLTVELAGAHGTEPGGTVPGESTELRPNQLVTVAGTGQMGFSGDGGPAVAAPLTEHLAMDVGPDGHLYIADEGAGRLRRVDSTGTIETVASFPSPTRFEAHFLPVPAAEEPRRIHDVAVADDGTVYVAGHTTVARIAEDGEATVIAGGGDHEIPDGGGSATATELGLLPKSVDVDADGTVYVADGATATVLRLDSSGAVEVVSGGGEIPSDEADGHQATEIGWISLDDIAVDSRGVIYVTSHDLENDTVLYRVDADGTVSVLAGLDRDGSAGDGAGVDDIASEDLGEGIAVDDTDSLYFTDTGDGIIRKIDRDGTVSSVGPALQGFPYGVQLASNGDLAVAPGGQVYMSSGAQVIMLVPGGDPLPVETESPSPAPDPWAGKEPGTAVTIAGTGEPVHRRDLDSGEMPRWARPTPVTTRPGELAVGADDALYYPDPLGHHIVRAEPGGQARVVAGRGNYDQFPFTATQGNRDGRASEERLYRPEAVAVDGDGTVYIADSVGITALDDGSLSTVIDAQDSLADAENGLEDSGGFDAEAASAIDGVVIEPRDLAPGSDGRVYVAEAARRRVLAVDADGTITTVAGGGDIPSAEADGSAATEASLREPEDVAIDADGTVYITERGVPAVRTVDTEGVLGTVAGNPRANAGEGGFSGDGGPAADAELTAPSDLAVGPDGDLYIADTLNHRIRRVGGDGVISTVAGTGDRGESGDGGPATEAVLGEPRALAFDADGNLYVSSSRGNAIRRVDPEGTITTAVETSAAGGVPAREVPLTAPSDVAAGPAGVLYLAGDPNGAVSGLTRLRPDGALHYVRTSRGAPVPATHVADAGNGAVYIGNDEAVVELHPDGTVVPVAGGVPASNPLADDRPEDGQPALHTSLEPAGLASGPQGLLYLVDQRHESLYRVDPDGALSTIADLPGDGRAGPIDVDAEGTVYMADREGDTVFRVDPDGTVEPFAGARGDDVSGDGSDEASRNEGDGASGDDDSDRGDGGPAVAAAIDGPTDVAAGAGGDVYIAEYGGVRRVDTDGTISTVYRVAENASGESTRDDARIRLDADSHGNVYVTVPGEHVVRALIRPGETADPSSWAPVAWTGGGLAVLATAMAAVLAWRRRRAGVASPARETAP